MEADINSCHGINFNFSFCPSLNIFYYLLLLVVSLISLCNCLLLVHLPDFLKKFWGKLLLFYSKIQVGRLAKKVFSLLFNRSKILDFASKGKEMLMFLRCVHPDLQEFGYDLRILKTATQGKLAIWKQFCLSFK